jgi:hypothetical protein
LAHPNFNLNLKFKLNINININIFAVPDNSLSFLISVMAAFPCAGSDDRENRTGGDFLTAQKRHHTGRPVARSHLRQAASLCLTSSSIRGNFRHSKHDHHNSLP